VLKCFTWTIQRFSVRLLKAGDSFRSDVFEAAGYQWRLELRLNGAAQQQHLGVRLLRAGLVPRALGWLLGGGGNDSSSPLKGQLLAATAPLVTYRCTLQSIAVGDGNYWAGT
jgi:hypothetical protein